MATSRKVTILERTDIVKLLRIEVARAGSQSAWGRKNGIDRAEVAKVLNGTFAPTRKVIRALGLRTVIISG